MVFGRARESFDIEAIVQSRSVVAAVTKVSKALLLVASAGRCQNAVRVTGIFGDDINDAVHRIRTPNGAAGTADHFDPVDVVHVGVLHFPVGAGKECRVNGTPINQHKNAAREPVAKPANSDGPLVRVNSRHFDAGRKTQSFGNAGGPGTTNLFARYHVDGNRAPEGFLRFLRGGCDFDLRQFLEAHVLEGCGTILAGVTW